MAEKSMLIRP